MVKRKLLGRCHLLALAVFVPMAPLAAQSTYPPVSRTTVANPPGAVVQPLPVIDPLAMNLKILAQNPYDVNALTQAGLSALEIGDAQAASGFLARADELSPRDGRIKAALGTALTLVERPQEALHTFGQAVAFGYPERMIAKDRGLAHDLNGDQKRAQKDYVLAEKQAQDPETIRRHALSLGISGQKDEALKLLDPLIRRNDQSAWRARAFVLALNGDMPQADRIIRAATPPSMVGGMSAFLRRLPSLTPAQRASAVNFGTIPTTGPVYAAADPAEPFRAINNGQMEGLLPPADVARTQSAAATVRPTLSRSEQRQAERREKELAKLAAKGAKASGVQVASATPVTRPPAPLPGMTAPPARPIASPPTTPPVQTAVLGQRVGPRIGPVDPARLPEELRPATSGATAAPLPKLVVVSGVTQLPPPDSARPKLEPFPPLAQTPVRVASVGLKPVPVTPPSVPVTTAAIQASPTNPFATPPAFPPVEPKAITPASAVGPVASMPDPLLPEPKPTQMAIADVKSVVPPANALPSVTTVPQVSPPVAVPAPIDTALVPVQPLVKAVDLPPSVPQGPLSTSSTPVAEPIALPPAATSNIGSAAPVSPPLVGPPATLANPASVVTASEPVQVAVAPPQPGFIAEAQPEPTPPAAPAPAPERPEPGARLASILEGIEQEAESAAAPLPSIAEIRAQKLAAQRKENAEAKAKLDKENVAKLAKEEAAKKAEEDAAKIKANPGRIWVQVATGANRSGLPITYRKLKGDAPKALGERPGWFVPFRSTFRLLVGPMKGPGDARQLVTALSKEGVSATTYSSEPGQEVTRLGGK